MENLQEIQVFKLRHDTIMNNKNIHKILLLAGIVILLGAIFYLAYEQFFIPKQNTLRIIRNNKNSNGDNNNDDLRVLMESKSSSKIIEAYKNEIKINLKKGYTGLVLDYSDKIIEINPYEFSGYYYRGVAKCRMGEFEEGISDYDVAIQLSPNVSSVYKDRGLAKFYLENYGEAMQDL
ncbi:MAG: tetratricopeptide repeat protein, partial [Fusobacteriaceae bacterium]